MESIWKYIVVALEAYLLGSLNFAIIISRLMAKTDVREHGSGNAGFTNFHRSVGGKKTFLVIAGDCVKCAAAVAAAGLLLGVEGRLIAGVFVMLGHMFPVYFNFKGGKGVLTTAVLILLMDWRAFIIGIGLFLLTVLITRYLSLGSILGVASVPVSFFFLYQGSPDLIKYLAILLFMTAIIIFMHRSNIKRLVSGSENKFTFKKDRENNGGGGDALS